MFDNFIWIILSIIVLSIWIGHMTFVLSLAKEKGDIGYKKYLIGLIPYFGVKYYVNQLKVHDIKSPLIEQNLIKAVLKKSRFWMEILGITYLIYLMVIGPFFLVNDKMRIIIHTYVFGIILLTHQGLVVDFARKKGYEGILPGLLGLIPFYGFAYYLNAKKRRNISMMGLLDTFKLKKVMGKVLLYAEILLIAVLIIVPIVYIFGLAFSNIRTAVPDTIWPANPTFESFKYLFEETKFKTWYGNTLKIAIINMVFGTVIITGAAYIFARFSFKGKKAGLLTLLVLQAFPSFMGLIAMVALFMEFGLLGKPSALSILYIGGSIPGNLWLIKGFLDQIPKDLDESAMIDGASKLQIFSKIILPLSVPILSFVAVGMFMGPWMDYMLPGFILQWAPVGAPADYDVTNNWTLAVGLFRMVNDLNHLHFSAFAAGALLVGLPITVLYMIFQRYLIEGIMAGATKG